MSNAERSTLASQLGVPVSQLDSMLNQLAYRREYNRRPDVVAKRREYTRVRNAKLTVLSNLLKTAMLKGGE